MSPARLLPPAVLGLWLLAALAGPLLAPAAERIDLDGILAPPALDAPLGRDELGRPVAERLIAGAGLSLFTAVVVVAVSAAFGTLVGVLSAWAGGWVETAAVAVMDVVLAFPGILLAIALAGLMGPGPGNVILALSAVSWVGYARLARAQTASVMQRDHVQAASLLGVPAGRIVLRHVLPLVAAPLLVEATFGLGAAVMAEAGLSFLGLGAQPPTASWGAMLRDGVRYMLVAPHLVLAPGLAVFACVLAVNLLGDRLRDVWDVRGRSGAPAGRGG